MTPPPDTPAGARLSGSTTTPLTSVVLSDRDRARFESHVDRTDHCWLWLSTIGEDGYARFWLNGTRRVAHRIAYMLTGREIPPGMVIDHACRVRHCVNPDHLRPLTNRENVLIGIGLSAVNARKTHCKHGHEFTPENTRISTEGFRVCRTCHRQRELRRRAAS